MKKTESIRTQTLGQLVQAGRTDNARNAPHEPVPASCRCPGSGSIVTFVALRGSEKVVATCNVCKNRKVPVYYRGGRYHLDVHKRVPHAE